VDKRLLGNKLSTELAYVLDSSHPRELIAVNYGQALYFVRVLADRLADEYELRSLRDDIFSELFRGFSISSRQNKGKIWLRALAIASRFCRRERRILKHELPFEEASYSTVDHKHLRYQQMMERRYKERGLRRAGLL